MTVMREDARLATLQMPSDVTEFVLHCDPDLPEVGIYFLVNDVRDVYRRRDELKLNFLSPPAQVFRRYVDSVKDPFGTILQLLDRTGGSSASSEDVRPASTG